MSNPISHKPVSSAPRYINCAITLSMMLAVLAGCHHYEALEGIAGHWVGSVNDRGKLSYALALDISQSRCRVDGWINFTELDVGPLALEALEEFKDGLRCEIPSLTDDLRLQGNVLNDTMIGRITGRSLNGEFKLRRVGPAMISTSNGPARRPYRAEELIIDRPDGKTSGTVTIPLTGNCFPGVVLLGGGGINDRNYGGAFPILADRLSRMGFIVLRYDDRGVGRSTGSKKELTMQQTAADALMAVAALKARADVDARRIGVIGHSEGSLVALLAANGSSDLRFLILLSAPGLSYKEILLRRTRVEVAKVAGSDDEAMEIIIRDHEFVLTLAASKLNQEELEKLLTSFVNTNVLTEEVRRDVLIRLKRQLAMYLTPHYRSLLKLDPSQLFESLRVPTLIIQGDHDHLLPVDTNLNAIRSSLIAGQPKDVTVITIPGLDHSLRKATNASSRESAISSPILDREVILQITQWVQNNIINPEHPSSKKQ